MIKEMLESVKLSLMRDLELAMYTQLATQLELHLSNERIALLKKDIEELDQQIKEQA